ncbi:RAMP superfamily CRISPR-associated protein [Plantactinospora sp. KBS50]|uniref:RAMP superfamily CRISPR-associated protein n=1 Tax=Plantactinospora sp. KBS50 TaxID=2024580 RepID=UPI000BAAF874|nr:RAMP superfamily CRISPR-associated protein [Plantactinospora sp. KBS50]ASW55507.1 hypothetical protein CIK06_16990 [Plantactinospora sp. KBS50]
MGQSTGERIEILGTLVCVGPVHVGGWDTTAEASLTVARDGTGRVCLPGTSIAGSLRAYLGGIHRFGGTAPNDPANALFGTVVPDSRDGSPSWLRVDDAHLIGNDVVPVVRDGVGIDRRSGSAAANFLYTRQLLPAGTRFALRIVADTPTGADAPNYPGGWPRLIDDAVATLVAGLRQGRVPIGAGRGRGLGRVELRDVTVRRADLSDPAGLVGWLAGRTPATGPAPEADPPPDGRLRITVRWKPLGPLLVRDSVAGTVVDTLPLTEMAVDDTVRLLLPGSSIRGTVRAHTERIVRTLRREDAPETFDEALRRPPPGVDVLFGSAPTGRRTDPDGAGTDGAGVDTGGSDSGWRGVLAFADCHSVERVPAEQWNRILAVVPDRVPDGSKAEPREQRQERNTERDRARSALRTTLDKIRLAIPLDVSDHVAIDRWTGGAADHRLFSVLDPAGTVAWDPIQIEVDTARLAASTDSAGATSAPLALPLLLLALRDLRDGWLSLGHGGTRGRGQIQVTEVTFAGDGLVEPWRSLAGNTLDAILADPPPQVEAAMTTWQSTFEEAA